MVELGLSLKNSLFVEDSFWFMTHGSDLKSKIMSQDQTRVLSLSLFPVQDSIPPLSTKKETNRVPVTGEEERIGHTFTHTCNNSNGTVISFFLWDRSIVSVST
jgi:hypothetical protein